MSPLLTIILLITSSYAQISCDKDSDCPNLYICSESDCKHKEFIPPDPTEIIAIFFILTASALGNAGGLGGGPIYTSILVLLP
jgi:hypothetical protein